MIEWKRDPGCDGRIDALDGMVGGVCLYYINYYTEQRYGNCGVGCDHEEYGDSEITYHAEPLTGDAGRDVEYYKDLCESHFRSWISSINARIENMRPHTVCSWCLSEGRNTIIHQGDENKPISHGMCEGCAEEFEKEEVGT